MNVDYFRVLRGQVIAAGYFEEIRWQENLKPCDNADEFFGQYLWVVVSAGLKNQVARKIELRIVDALERGKTAQSAFKHNSKSKAIDWVSNHRQDYWGKYQAASDKIAFLRGIPWIGDITKYHLAKNLGIDVAKPDRHLERLADHYNTTVEALCAKLATETGLRVSTIDLILWRASNIGLIKTAALKEAHKCGLSG